MARRYRYKPTKVQGAFSIVVGTAMLVFAITSFSRAHGSGLVFLIFWCVLVVAITCMNAWAAFSEKGSLGTLQPRGRGRLVKEDEEVADADENRRPYR